eukprot:m.236323 g.236323  ORF g.236323 m.236323 type:complete len:428 (-) comp12956_c0_seq1:341-1624(-)
MEAPPQVEQPLWFDDEILLSNGLPFYSRGHAGAAQPMQVATSQQFQLLSAHSAQPHGHEDASKASDASCLPFAFAHAPVGAMPAADMGGFQGLPGQVPFNASQLRSCDALAMSAALESSKFGRLFHPHMRPGAVPPFFLGANSLFFDMGSNPYATPPSAYMPAAAAFLATQQAVAAVAAAAAAVGPNKAPTTMANVVPAMPIAIAAPSTIASSDCTDARAQEGRPSRACRQKRSADREDDSDDDSDDSDESLKGPRGRGRPVGRRNTPTTAEEKRYVCTIAGCQQRYKTQPGLKYHQAHGHTSGKKIRSFQCEECGRAFETDQLRRVHMSQHDNKAPTCEFCGRQFARMASLVRHITMCYAKGKEDGDDATAQGPAEPATKETCAPQRAAPAAAASDAVAQATPSAPVGPTSSESSPINPAGQDASP